MRSGAALPATLFALAIMSAMAVGGIYVTRRHVAASAETSAALGLGPLAERAALDVVISWDSAARASQAVGQTETLAAAPGSSVRVTRTTESEFLVVALTTARTRPVLRYRVALTVVVINGRPRPAFPRAWAELPLVE